MYKMCRKINKNKGSSVVEMCVIMPLIFTIIVMLTFLFLDVVNSSAVQGKIYSSLYSYDGDNPAEGGIFHSNGEICMDGDAFDAVFETGIYSYDGESVEYSTEYGSCTKRLWRWQLYGNVFWE